MLTGVDRAASVLVDGSRIGTGDCFLKLNVLTRPLLLFKVFCVTKVLANRETLLTVTGYFCADPLFRAAGVLNPPAPGVASAQPGAGEPRPRLAEGVPGPAPRAAAAAVAR